VGAVSTALDVVVIFLLSALLGGFFVYG